MCVCCVFFFFSSRRRHTRCALVTGVQTCALPIFTLLSPSGTTTVMGTVPRMKTYRIAGLFEVGMAVYDEGFIYVPLQAAKLFFRLPGSVNAVEVYAQSPDDAFDVGRRIQQALGPGYRIVAWQRSNPSFFGAIQPQRNRMLLHLDQNKPR